MADFLGARRLANNYMDFAAMGRKRDERVRGAPR